MPPKRRKVKESEEEILLNEKLTEAFYKYRQEDDETDENVGMFASEDELQLRIRIDDIPNVVREVGMKWDDALTAVLDHSQTESGLIRIDVMKLILATLAVIYSKMLG